MRYQVTIRGYIETNDKTDRADINDFENAVFDADLGLEELRVEYIPTEARHEPHA